MGVNDRSHTSAGQESPGRVDMPIPDPAVDTSVSSSASSDSSSSSPIAETHDNPACIPSPPSPTGRSRTHQNALGINIPPPSITPGPLSAPAVPFPAPALRRTSSCLSGGSAGGSNHGASSREKKRLRFTPVVDSEEFGRSGARDRESGNGSETGSEEEWERGSIYDAEEAGEDGQGGDKGNGKWRGYDHMKSDPGTPSLAET